MVEYTKEQLQAINHDRGNILVSASAGSGKTFVMIERLIRLIAEGKAGIKDILAVTFTEAAASEMKEKLKKALTEKIGEGKRELIPELLEVSTADISTMHAFCAKLIRTYFYAVGLSPDFKILDANQANTIKADCLQKVFNGLYQEKSDWFFRLFDCHAKKRLDGGLKAIIGNLYDFFESEANPEAYYNLFEQNYSEEGFEKLCGEYKKYIDNSLNIFLDRARVCLIGLNQKGLKKGAEFCVHLQNSIREMLSCNLFELKRFETFSLKLAFETKLDEEGLSLKEEAKDIRDGVCELLEEVCSSVSDSQTERGKLAELYSHAESVVKVLRLFKEAYASAKAEDNLLDFNDLEHFALKILSDETAYGEDGKTICNAVKEKYKYIFIDEYQDTNGVQECIINKLANDNVFMVGDEKQSIYAFRGCRPEFFHDKFLKMQRNGEQTVILNDNFRSAQAVLDSVNQIFGYSMTGEYYGMDYRGNFDLKNGKVYPEDKTGRVNLHFFQKTRAPKAPLEKPRIYDVLDCLDDEQEVQRADETSLICDIILKELGSEYYDFKEKTIKRVTFSDIAILAGHRGNAYVSKMVRSLVAHNIPVSSLVKQNLCDFPEVSVLLNLLKLIDNFEQDIPLAIVLKSAIGGLSEEDLAEIALYYRDNCQKEGKNGGYYTAVNYYIQNAKTPLAQKLKEFSEYFAKIRVLADYYGTADILERVIQDFSMENFLLAEKGGRDKVKRVKQFINVARSGDGKLTVREFLKKVKTSPEAFEAGECNEENAVKVMTVHASKGLEFPVVIVVETASKFIGGGKDGDEMLLDREYGFALKSFNHKDRTTEETLLRSLIRFRAKNQSMKEAMRLFYVATTRAKYSMHIVYGASKDSRRNNFTGAEAYIDFIPAQMPKQSYCAEDFDFIELKNQTRTVMLSKTDEVALEKMRDNFAYVYPFEEDTALPLKASVTGTINHNQEEPVYYIYSEGKTDAERGSIAHKIMEYYNPTGGDFHAQVEDIIERGILSREQVEKINLERLNSVIAGGALAQFRGQLYREQPFIVNIPASKLFGTQSEEEVLVQGIIDLLEISQEGIRIADYKYSALSKESLFNKYRKQLELYSYAAQKITGKNVIERVLINIYSGETIKF